MSVGLIVAAKAILSGVGQCASADQANVAATSCDHLNSSLFDLDIGYFTLSFSLSSNLTELFPLLTP